MTIVYFEGAYLPEEEAKIPVSDRGLLMGDGVYITVQVKDGVPLFLKRHLLKLDEQAKKLHLDYPLLDEKIIFKLIEENRAFEGTWRLKVYYTGGDDLSMRLPLGRRGRVLMILKPYTVPPYAPLQVGIFPQPVVALQGTFKSLSHLGRYMVMEHALRIGMDDCLTTTEKGTLLEASFGNIFWIVDKEFYTPHPILPLHFGVTISIVSEMAKDLGFSPHFVRGPFSSIPDKALLFRTNAMGGIRPISLAEGRSFSRNLEIEEQLLNTFAKMGK